MCRVYMVWKTVAENMRNLKKDSILYTICMPPPPGDSHMKVAGYSWESDWRTVWVLLVQSGSSFSVTQHRERGVAWQRKRGQSWRVLCFRFYLTLKETILQRKGQASLSLSYGSPLPRVFCIKKEKKRRQQEVKDGFSYSCPIPLPQTDNIQEILFLSLFCRFHSVIF